MSVSQAGQIILDANRHAFVNGDRNRIKTGSVITLPDSLSGGSSTNPNTSAVPETAVDEVAETSTTAATTSGAMPVATADAEVDTASVPDDAAQQDAGPADANQSATMLEAAAAPDRSSPAAADRPDARAETASPSRMDPTPASNPSAAESGRNPLFMLLIAALFATAVAIFARFLSGRKDRDSTAADAADSSPADDTVLEDQTDRLPILLHLDADVLTAARELANEELDVNLDSGSGLGDFGDVDFIADFDVSADDDANVPLDFEFGENNDDSDSPEHCSGVVSLGRSPEASILDNEMPLADAAVPDDDQEPTVVIPPMRISEPSILDHEVLPENIPVSEDDNEPAVASAPVVQAIDPTLDHELTPEEPVFAAGDSEPTVVIPPMRTSETSILDQEILPSDDANPETVEDTSVVAALESDTTGSIPGDGNLHAGNEDSDNEDDYELSMIVDATEARYCEERDVTTQKLIAIEVVDRDRSNESLSDYTLTKEVDYRIPDPAEGIEVEMPSSSARHKRDPGESALMPGLPETPLMEDTAFLQCFSANDESMVTLSASAGADDVDVAPAADRLDSSDSNMEHHPDELDTSANSANESMAANEDPRTEAGRDTLAGRKCQITAETLIDDDDDTVEAKILPPVSL